MSLKAHARSFPCAACVWFCLPALTGAAAWGSWQQTHKLTADDAAAGDTFGRSVSISQGTAIVGSDDDDDAGEDSGAAYVFDATTGQRLHRLTGDDSGSAYLFGKVQCPADFDGDVDVDTADLLALLGARGECPQGTPVDDDGRTRRSSDEMK